MAVLFLALYHILNSCLGILFLQKDKKMRNDKLWCKRRIFSCFMIFVIYFRFIWNKFEKFIFFIIIF